MRAWIMLDMDDRDLSEAYGGARLEAQARDIADSLRARLSEVYVLDGLEVRGEVAAVRLRRPDGVLVEPHPDGYTVPR